MIFCEKFLQKIKISLRRDVEKLISRKRYFCLFVCLYVFISAIKLPRIPTYLLKYNMYNIAKNKKKENNISVILLTHIFCISFFRR